MNGKLKSKRNRSEYTAIKMDRELHKRAKERAVSRHQTYSEYVRQLIVQDLAEPEKAVAA